MIPREAKLAPTIACDALKLTQLIRAGDLPRHLLAPDGEPQPDVAISLSLTGTTITALAVIGGKNYRKTLKAVAEHGADSCVILLTGKLVPGPQPGSLVLAGASLNTAPKLPPKAAGPL